MFRLCSLDDCMIAFVDLKQIDLALVLNKQGDVFIIARLVTLVFWSHKAVRTHYEFVRSTSKFERTIRYKILLCCTLDNGRIHELFRHAQQITDGWILRPIHVQLPS